MRLLLLIFIINFNFLFSQTAFDYWNTGLKYESSKDYSKAILEYTKAIEIDSLYQIAFSQRGNAKYLLKDFRGAILDFSKSIELKKDYLDFYFRGKCYFLLNKLDDALSDFNKAIELNEKHALAYYNRGLVRIELNDLEKGCLDLSKAGELGYTFAYDKILEHCNK